MRGYADRCLLHALFLQNDSRSRAGVQGSRGAGLQLLQVYDLAKGKPT